MVHRRVRAELISSMTGTGGGGEDLLEVEAGVVREGAVQIELDL